MDRSNEAKGWRRGVAAGLLALALSVGGQLAFGGASGACPLEPRFGLAERLVEHFKPALRAHGGVAQRVALAVLGAVLHTRCG